MVVVLVGDGGKGGDDGSCRRSKQETEKSSESAELMSPEPKGVAGILKTVPLSFSLTHTHPLETESPPQGLLMADGSRGSEGCRLTTHRPSYRH